MAQSLETGDRRVIIERGTDARYVPTGHLVYWLDGALLAVPFDPDRLEFTGGPIPVIDDIRPAMTGIGDRTPFAMTGPTNFDLSENGMLVYLAGTAHAVQPQRTLVWVGRDGSEQTLSAKPRAYTYARISPDGKRIALDVRDQERDIWIWDLSREALIRLTFGPASEQRIVWTRDGAHVIFSSTREPSPGGPGGLWWKAADGTGAGEALDTADGGVPDSVSRDGKWLFFMGGLGGIFRMSLEQDRTRESVVAEDAFVGSAEPSPDGRWLAYRSNVSGENEVYVRPMTGESPGRWQISNGGGVKPMWGPDGSELFYVDSTGRLMRVPVVTEPTFSAERPEVLFEASYFMGDYARNYDISADGQRFLMIKELDTEAAPPPEQIHVVINWFEELERLVPTKN